MLQYFIYNRVVLSLWLRFIYQLLPLTYLLPPAPPLLVGFYEPLDAAVEGPFHVVREHAGRELTRPQVAPQTFAALSFFAARLIGAAAPCLRAFIRALRHWGLLSSASAMRRKGPPTARG